MNGHGTEAVMAHMKNNIFPDIENYSLSFDCFSGLAAVTNSILFAHKYCPFVISSLAQPGEILQFSPCFVSEVRIVLRAVESIHRFLQSKVEGAFGETSRIRPNMIVIP